MLIVDHLAMSCDRRVGGVASVSPTGPLHPAAALRWVLAPLIADDRLSIRDGPAPARSVTLIRLGRTVRP